MKFVSSNGINYTQSNLKIQHLRALSENILEKKFLLNLRGYLRSRSYIKLWMSNQDMKTVYSEGRAKLLHKSMQRTQKPTTMHIISQLKELNNEIFSITCQIIIIHNVPHQTLSLSSSKNEKLLQQQ